MKNVVPLACLLSFASSVAAFPCGGLALRFGGQTRVLTCMIPRAARGSMAARMSYLDDLNEDEAAAAKVVARTNAGKQQDLPSPAIPEDEVVIPLPAIPDEAILPVFFEGLEAAAPPPDTSTVAAPIPTAEPPLPTPVPSPTAASPKPFKKPQEPSTDKKVASLHVGNPATLGLAEPILGGNEGAETLFAFLQSKTYSKDREGLLLGDIFADGIIRNGGFSEFSEKVNGRVAQIGFVLDLGHMGNGNVLSQLADHPIQALALSGLVTLASLPPMFDARTDDRRGIAVFRAVVPAGIRNQLQEAFDKSAAKDIFTEKAELSNSRAAMLAMGVWLLTATFF